MRQPFTKEPVCPKCGGERHRYEHLADGPGESLYVTCERCGYFWEMECADAKMPDSVDEYGEHTCRNCKYWDKPDTPNYAGVCRAKNQVFTRSQAGYYCRLWEAKPPDTPSPNLAGITWKRCCECFSYPDSTRPTGRCPILGLEVPATQASCHWFRPKPPDTASGKGELLPCPWCGGEAKAWQGREGWIVSCEDMSGCPAKPEMLIHYKTEAEAVAAWNRRGNE